MGSAFMESAAPADAARITPNAPLWLLALFTFSGTLAMHIFVPALGIAGHDLHASNAAMQMTVGFYIFGLAIGQLFYGPLSDRFGRRPALVAGLVIYTAAGVVCVLATQVNVLIVARLFGRDGRVGVVGGVSSAFSNLVLLGIPFMIGVFGQPGVDVLSLLVSVHLPLMMMASIILFEIFGPRGDGQFRALKVLRSFGSRLFSNPLIIGILAGLAWRFVGLPLPALAARLVDALADVAGPVALFAMGLGLRRFGISGNVRPALALSFLKLLVMPALALALVWLFGLPPLTAKVVVIAAGLPSGVNSYLIATQFGTGQALASNQLTIATALAVATMAFWLVVVQHVFG